jgi:hypothetical protein
MESGSDAADVERSALTMYGKLFASMYDGSLVGGKFPWQALVTLQQMIILSDKDGVIDMTLSALHRKTGIPLEILEVGIEALKQPDPDSRTPTFEGRRIVPLDETRAWGWLVVNKEQYAKMRDPAERREYMRQKQAERRASIREESDREFGAGDSGEKCQILSTSDVLTSYSDHANNGTAGDKSLNGNEMGVGNDKMSTQSTHIDVDVNRDVDVKEKKEIVGLTIVSGKLKAPPLPAISGSKTMLAVRERLASVTTEIIDGTRRRLAIDQMRTLQAELIFAYWAAKMDHPKTILDDKRERLIVKRLSENDGDVSELMYAIDGALRDDWIMGRDPKSTKKYDGIETLFRDRAQIERLASNMKRYKANEIHPMVAKHLAAMENSNANIQPDKADVR